MKIIFLLFLGIQAAFAQAELFSCPDALDEGSYIVKGSISCAGRLVINGKVDIHLDEGSELNAENGGISVNDSSALTISGKGSLNANSLDVPGAAGIGGDPDTPGGTIIINGGVNIISLAGCPNIIGNGGDPADCEDDPDPDCIPFNQLVVKRWGNTLSVISPENNSKYVWYRDSTQIIEGQWWYAGENGEQIPKGSYHIEIIAQNGDTSNSCPEYIDYEQGSGASKTPELKNANNAAYDVLGRLASRKNAYKVLLRKAK